ncbi:MAG: hypothetical protein SGJ01_18975 [Gemmatimonadota bacterium]|nr:hypothetical protein [Gemmatimonadota bacterium]
MKTPSLAFLLPALLATTPLMAQAPATSLTLYNDGRVLVRRLVSLDLKKGESTQLVALGEVDPATLFTLDSGVTLLGTRYDAAVDESRALNRAIGRTLTFQVGKEIVSAEVLGVNPERYRLTDGTITFQRPGSPRFPAELVSLQPTLSLSLAADRARKELRLGYFTQGGGWGASYQVILGGATARITGAAVVNGGPLRVEDAELQLLAGQVSVAAPERDRYRLEGRMVANAAMAMDAKMGEQKVGEFHLYTLPGRVSLEPGVITTVALFPAADAKTTKTYQVHGRIPWWGGLDQNGDEAEEPVNVVYTVLRARKTDFGDRPIPAGVVRLFEPDSAGRLQLVGEAATDHTPAGEDLRLNAGTAFDLTAKRIQTTYSTRRDTTVAGVNRTIATADYKVTLTNAGSEPAAVEVLEERGGEWSVVSSSIKAEKLSSTRTRFRVLVPAAGKATLTYRVRVIW